MVAETFKVRDWLEDPAKWLRWAMQSLSARKLTDAQYNLQQFWKALEQAKKGDRSPQQWAEILTLDSQSQWTLGNLYGALKGEVLRVTNQAATGPELMLDPWVAVPLALMLPIAGALQWLGGRQVLKLQVTKAREVLADLSAKEQQAFGRGKALAEQAQKAYAGLRRPVKANQAANTLHVVSNSLKAAPLMATQEQRQLPQVPDLPPLPSLPSFSVPWWAWAAATGVVLLVVTTSVTTPVVMASNARRTWA